MIDQAVKDISSRITNRVIALYHLRVNPNKRGQGLYRLSLDNDRCAIGLISEAFGVTYPLNTNEEDKDPYLLVGDKLGIPYIKILRMNDDEKMSFAEIASALEKIFKEENYDR